MYVYSDRAAPVMNPDSSNLFYYLFSLSAVPAVSTWDTSNVTNMSGVFDYAGRSASTWSVVIPQTNGNGINNTTSQMYGKTTSTYATPTSGKSFTLAS